MKKYLTFLFLSLSLLSFGAIEDEYLFKIELPDDGFVSFVSDETMPGSGKNLNSEMITFRRTKWRELVEKEQNAGSYSFLTLSYKENFEMVFSTSGEERLYKELFGDKKNKLYDLSKRQQEFNIVNFGRDGLSVKWECKGVFSLRDEQCVKDLYMVSTNDLLEYLRGLDEETLKFKCDIILNSEVLSGKKDEIWRNVIHDYLDKRGVMPEVKFRNCLNSSVRLEIDGVNNNIGIPPDKEYLLKVTKNMIDSKGIVNFRYRFLPIGDGLCSNDYNLQFVDYTGGDIIIPEDYSFARKNKPNLVFSNDILPADLTMYDLKIDVVYRDRNVSISGDDLSFDDDSACYYIPLEPHKYIEQIVFSYPEYEQLVIYPQREFCSADGFVDLSALYDGHKMSRFPWMSIDFDIQSGNGNVAPWTGDFYVDILGKKFDGGKIVNLNALLDDVSDSTNIEIRAFCGRDLTPQYVTNIVARRSENGLVETIYLPLHKFVPKAIDGYIPDSYLKQTYLEYKRNKKKTSKGPSNLRRICKGQVVDDFGRDIPGGAIKALSAIDNTIAHIDDILDNLGVNAECPIDGCECKRYFDVVRDVKKNLGSIEEKRIAVIAVRLSEEITVSYSEVYNLLKELCE